MKKGLAKEFNQKLITSIFVIILYFAWPILIKWLLQLFGISFEVMSMSLWQIIYNVASNVILMVILIMIYRNNFIKFIKEFKEKYRQYLLIISKYLVLSIIITIIINVTKTHLLNIEEVAENDVILGTYFKQLPLLMFFMTIIYYPIVEEIVFNHTIKELIKNKWLYIFVSALFFWYFNIAFVGISYVSIVSSFYYFILAFIRASAYYKTDNLLVPIGIKMIYNTFVSIISL